MKKHALIFLTTILSLNCYSQISFEKGYYIDGSGQKVDCLIKNIDWKNNPTKFEYKLSENTETKIATIESVIEFGIYNASKYNRHTVKIDRSIEDINNLSTVKAPLFQEKQLFLKVLIEGNANLYLHEDEYGRRYFYKTSDSEVEQLVYKRYFISKNKIRKNNRFKQQLWNGLKCQEISMKEIEQIDYTKNELADFFVKYNKCGNHEFFNFDEKQKRNLFNLTVRPGINSSSLTIQHSSSTSRNTDFDNELGARLGIEVEFIMPYNKNKWAIVLEPTYQYFKSEKELTIQNVKADYTSIEIPIGIRHYMFLNENSKLFINGSFILDFTSGSKIDFESSPDFEIETRNNLAFGIGYNYNEKYSLELRYQTGREILSNYLYWSSDYNTISVIFGYSLF